MKIYTTALLAALVIASAAMFTLDSYQRQADRAYASSESVRLPAHGDTHNLIGRNWDGGRVH